jgi:RHS repeat-associated protein
MGGGYTYDAAGNMTYDPTPGYQLTNTWDQENRLTGAAGYTYTYDGDGNRVRKSNGNSASNGTLYWYMSPGVVVETDLAGTLKSEYVFFDGERVARKDFPGNTVAYYFSDHLKTASVITDSAGVIKAESDYYPWGGELQFVNNDANDYKFTGKKRDTETGLDYFGARYYSNGLGRWVSADWSATPVPVPYADFGDPQTLNLYQFVGGNPGSRTDVDGHSVLDLLLKTVGLAGDAATAIDSGKTILDSKAPVGDRIGATLNLASIVITPLAVQKTDPFQAKVQDSLEKLGIKKSGNVELHEVGTANDLKNRSEPGDGLDIHHAPQAHAAEQSIPGYDPKTGPAIAVTQAEHRALNQANIKGATALSPRQLMAKTAQDLRNEKIPNSAVKRVVELAKKIFPALEKVRK